MDAAFAADLASWGPFWAAAARAAATPAPAAVSAEEARGLLGGPGAFDPGPGRGRIGDPDHLDVTHFTEALDGEDWRFKDLLADGAPEQMAGYKQAHVALIALAPGLLGHGTPGGEALDAMDEAALALWSAAWMGGIRAGSAYEHLRQALMPPTSICGRCQGHGRLWDGKPYRLLAGGGNKETCPDCAGAGTVPTPRPRLEAGG